MTSAFAAIHPVSPDHRGFAEPKYSPRRVACSLQEKACKPVYSTSLVIHVTPRETLFEAESGIPPRQRCSEFMKMICEAAAVVLLDSCLSASCSKVSGASVTALKAISSFVLVLALPDNCPLKSCNSIIIGDPMRILCSCAWCMSSIYLHPTWACYAGKPLWTAGCDPFC